MFFTLKQHAIVRTSSSIESYIMSYLCSFIKRTGSEAKVRSKEQLPGEVSGLLLAPRAELLTVPINCLASMLCRPTAATIAQISATAASRLSPGLAASASTNEKSCQQMLVKIVKHFCSLLPASMGKGLGDTIDVQ